MRRATILLWKKEIRAANDLRRRNPRGYVEFVRDLAARTTRCDSTLRRRALKRHAHTCAEPKSSLDGFSSLINTLSLATGRVRT
jgi:hypothetical protein